METKEFYKRLRELNIPIAYGCFSTSQALPYIVYTESGNLSGGDYLQSTRRIIYEVELYTSKRDLNIESQLENILKEIGPFDVDYAMYIKDTNSFLTKYTVEVYRKE